MANGLVVYLYNVTLSTQIQASLTHKSFSVPQQFLPTIHTLSGCTGGDSGFRTFPKDTLTCRWEELGIKPMTFWLVDDPLFLLSHSSPTKILLLFFLTTPVFR